MPNNRFILFILIILAIGIGAYFWYQPAPDSSPSKDEMTFLSTEINLSYDDFLKDLERTCPYYEPNGVQYRDCLLTLLEKREQEVDAYQADLIRGLQANTDSEFLTARQTFIMHLKELNTMWGSYRDTLCMTKADENWGGSNQGGFFNTCRLYETEKYQLLLANFRDVWGR